MIVEGKFPVDRSKKQFQSLPMARLSYQLMLSSRGIRTYGKKQGLRWRVLRVRDLDKPDLALPQRYEDFSIRGRG
jgi:hypothetical protein